MRVIVCGGRGARDQDVVWAALDKIHAETPITLVIEGGQRSYEHGVENGPPIGGVDYFAFTWARARGIQRARFDADWQTHRRAAGPIRNRRMLKEGKPDAVVAFPGGAGTADMVRQARNAGVKVLSTG